MGTSLLWQTDTQLHDAVQRQLAWDPEINARDIGLTASDGVITLTGFVNSYAEKLAAEHTVKRVRGVRAVADDMLPPKQVPTLDGIQTILAGLVKEEPKAKGAKAEDFVDSRFVSELDQNGFIDSLYRR